MVQSLLTCVVPYCRTVLASVTLVCLFGGFEAPGWMICFGVDRPGPRWTGCFMENPTLIGVSLSDVRVTMVIMHVLVVELQCQAVMG
jgi:hypothetical protein